MEARDWSQLDAIRAMRAHSPKELPDDASLSASNIVATQGGHYLQRDEPGLVRD